ncbi:MAG: hypothetical protein H6807_12975 [Planctomycetes bacterium]|nr:hypothetical protein [Planctomycetota bacterium]
MKRRHCFLLTIVFLAGLIMLDWELARRPGKIEAVLRREIEKLLKVPFRHLPVQIVSPTEVRVRDITIFARHNSNDEFLRCDELVARIDFWKLLGGDLEFDEIEVNGPELHLRWSEGELSLPSIFEQTETGGGMKAPEISIHGMNVVFHDAPFWGAERVSITGIDLQMRPDPLSRNHPYALSGSIEDQVFGRFDLKAGIGSARLRGSVTRRGFRLGPEHTAYLSNSLRETLDRIKMSEGAINLQVAFEAEDVLDRIDYTVTAELDGVSLGYEAWPFAVTGLNGTFRLDDLVLVAQDLEFQLAGADVDVQQLSVDFDGVEPGFEAVAKVTDLHLDDQVALDLRRLPEPFPDVGEALEALGARGSIDVDVDLRKPKRPARVAVDILAKFRKAQLSYQGFEEADGTREGYPYPLESIIGTVHIGNDGLEFWDLTSTVRSPDLRANGWVTYGQKPLAYAIDIQGFDVHLDEKVRMTLPVAEREIYDSYEPTGPVNFGLVIKRPAGRDGPPDVTLDVELRGCSALPRLFPYPINDMRGHLLFGEAGGTNIKDVTASNKRARFTIEGQLDHSAAVDDPAYELDIVVEDLAVDEPLLIGLSAEFPEIASELRRWNFVGDVDFQCHISSAAEGANNHFAADLKGLSFCYEEFDTAPCSNLRGRVEAKGDRLDIMRSTFELAGCEVSASGWVDIGTGGAHELFLECPELLVNEQTIGVAAEAAPYVGQLAELMDVRGAVTLDLKMRKGSRGELVRTAITAQGLRIELKEPALVFEDVHGSMTIEGPDLVFEGWTAALPYGDGIEDRDRLIVNVNRGRWRRGDQGDFLNVHEIGFRDLMLDERLFRRLPEDWARTLRDWELRGRLAGRVTSLLLRDGEAGFKGELVPSELSCDPGVAIGLNHGSIMIEDASISDEGFDVKGSLVDADLTVLRFPVVHANALFQVDQRSVALRDLAGDCLGGRVNPHETYFVMDHGIDGHFETSVSLSEIDLSEWRRAFGGDPKRLSGRATAWGRMDGLVASHDTYRGQGELWLSGRQLYDLPLLATLLQFLNLDFLANDEVQTAHCGVRIEDEKVLVEDALFDGPGVRLSGGGHIGFDGIAQLEFEPSIIKLLDPIPLVGDLVNFAMGFMVSKIKITGPLEDMRAEGENHITALLPGEEDSGRRLKPREVVPETEK